MKSVIIIAASLALSAPLAFAQERLSDGAYLPAVRCVAFAELPQLQGDAFNAAALKEAVDSYSGPFFMRDRARNASRTVRMAGLRAGDDASETSDLRDDRNDACAGFIASGLVQASGAASAS